MPPKNKKGGKSKNDDWDDDAAEKKLAALAVKDESDGDKFSESEDEAPPKAAGKNKLAAFAMLDASEGSDAAHSDSDGDAKKEESPKKEEKKAPADAKKKKQKGGKKGKDKEEVDELDALLENLDKPVEKEAKGKKAKKKEKQEKAAAEGEEAEGAETPAPAKDASAEPEAEAAADDEGKKKKKKKKKGGKDKEETPEGEEAKEEEEKEGETPKKEDEGEEGEEGEEEGEGKKKTRKDKKKEKEKKEKEKGKKKGDKKVDVLKEYLRKKQELEEAEAARVKEEEERLTALYAKREEEERLAKEKREREKAKKKEREEQLKKEGKWLTPAQREKQRIQQEKLAASLASGNVAIAAREAEGEKEGQPKKRVLYGKKKPQQKKAEDGSQEVTPPPAAVAEVKPAVKEESPVAPVPEEKKDEVIEDDWEKKDDEPLDDWEMAEKEEEEKEKTPPPTTAAKGAASATRQPAKAGEAKKKSSEEEEDESSSESDEESSSEESSDEDSDEEESSESEEETKGKETKEQIVERVKGRIKKRREAAEARRSTDTLRAPVICVLGHVDTGKTKMLDTIRRTNVQDGEAGGITQQIGATQVPAEAIKERCKNVRDFDGEAMKLPGFLIIDTPGHESFSNLRSRGSSLCDFAILVVDIMHGLEPQTIESLKLLLKRQTPFVIALNKIDRLYGYESNPRKDVYAHLKSQPNNTQLEFKDRYEKVVTEFAEQSVNVCLSNAIKGKEDEYIAMVPTSAFMGDGIGNIMSFIVSQTQTRHAKKLAYCEELDATVMEVKAIAGLGTTIDVILVNGALNVGDIIILTGSDGPIMTQIRELLMPQPLREMRVKNEYGHYKQIKGAQGVKVLAKGLEKALAGLPLYVAHKDDEVDVLRDEAEAQLSKALTAIKRKAEGVYVQASTLGSLEALLEFLKSQKIPYSNVNIGPVHKRDVQKAAAMLEHNPEYACVLAFDVKVERDAQQFADHEGVKIFQADIIYHLEDNFLKYREELRLKARKDNEHLAIFPAKLRILPQHIFNARNPIVIGVQVEAGQLKKGAPICVPSKDCIFLGNVASIERNHEQVDLAKAGEEICIKIENTTGEAPKLYGRHFTHEDQLVTRINRESIDVCKEFFRDDLSKTDWQLIVQLKKLLDIM